MPSIPRPKTLASLPPEHRSPIVMNKARQFHPSIPNELRSLPDVGELRDLLAIGPAPSD
jgi:hypothetical protein